MAHYQSYRCPECQGAFRYLHHPDDSDPPDRCPLCGAWVSEDEPVEETFIPQAPMVRKSDYAKAVDQSYRAIEDASIQRAEEAADQLRDTYAAQPRDEAFESGLLEVTQKQEVAALRSELKITNMKDPSQMRAGDNAVIGGAVTPALVNGAGYRQMAGPVPGTGTNAPMISNMTADHTPRAISMIRAGQLNR